MLVRSFGAGRSQTSISHVNVFLSIKSHFAGTPAAFISLT